MNAQAPTKATSGRPAYSPKVYAVLTACRMIGCVIVIFAMLYHTVLVYMYIIDQGVGLQICTLGCLFLPVCLYLCLCLSVSVSVFLSFSFSLCLYLSVSLCVSVCMSVCMSVCLSVCLSLSHTLSISLSLS